MRPARMTGRHYAEHGLVACPARERDVDLETCMRCRLLRAITDDRTCVLCEGQPLEAREERGANGALAPD